MNKLCRFSIGHFYFENQKGTTVIFSKNRMIKIVTDFDETFSDYEGHHDIYKNPISFSK